MANTRPITTLRDGSLKATIWKNTSPKGDFFSARLSRSYRDGDGKWRDSDRFSHTEMLQLAHLASRAYDELGKLCAQDRAATTPAEPADGRQT